MLFLLFQLGDDRYALDARQVVEVLPLVALRRVPLAPPALAGLFDFHGRPVPALDLSRLATGRAAPPRMSTRIVLVRYPPATAGGREQLVGLIVEKLTQTVRREWSDFVDPGVRPGQAPYLGPVATGPDGLLQYVDIGRLLPPSMQELALVPEVLER